MVLPLSETRVTLLSGVNFYNDYKDTRYFTTLAQQQAYFQARNKVYETFENNFQRTDTTMTLKVFKSVDELWNVNYIMYQNREYGNKWFYGFVTKVEYTNSKVTTIHFEIDVIQTWMFELEFKQSFVVREHSSYTKINTLDEGLDYGTEYEVKNVEQVSPYHPITFLVIVAKETMHPVGGDTKKEKAIVPNVNGVVQPLSYYVTPIKATGESVGKVSISNGTPTQLTSAPLTLEGLYTQVQTQNNIVSIYITDSLGIPVQYDEANDIMHVTDSQFEIARIADDTGANVITMYMKEMVQYGSEVKSLGNKTKSFDTSGKEPKLLQSPYCIIEVTDFKGNKATIKPEYINQQNLELGIMGSMGTSNKVAYIVQNYNMITGTDYHLQTGLENGLISNSPNSIPVVSDYLSAFLQGNQNSLENQRNSIMWGGFSQSVNGALSAGASGTMGSGFGVASAGANFVTGMGDTILALQGMNAKKEDISNTPPQLTQMGNNINFDFGHKISGVFVVKKQIKKEYIDRLSNFMHMFGYKTNELKTINMNTRTHFNFVQTKSCNVYADIGNAYLDRVKDIMDGGITLWHVDDIGNYNVANEVK